MSCNEFGLLKLIRQIRAATKFEQVFSISKFQITFLVVVKQSLISVGIFT